MSLKSLLNQDRLKKHTTSKNEIENLLNLIKRDLDDACIQGLSSDRKFSIVYNAVLQLSTIIIYCTGYKTRGEGHHFYSFQTLKYILDKQKHDLVDYFDSCRVKRNIVDYDMAGRISSKDAEELLIEAKKYQEFVLRWLHQYHPEFSNS